MNIKSFLGYSIFIFFFTSCNGTVERDKQEYFDMEGLVSQQIRLLNSLDPYLIKKASINGVEEEKNRKLDSAEWVSELSIFMETDINKPKLMGNYNKEELEKDNQKVILYTAKDPAEVQVEFLKIIYQNERLNSIESFFTEKNILYVTRRKLEMTFSQNQGEPILSDYRITGQQKMILKDTINYKIDSKILFN